MFFQRRKWPRLDHNEIVRRARLLVIDDQDFPYRKLFQRDGYNIDKRNDVGDLTDLESARYDLILLDLLGVGRKESADQGLGVLKHIRTTSPAQLVVAYSNAEWPVRYQPFFLMADSVLPKTADYVDFKRIVDELLERRFSLGFYVARIQAEAGDYSAEMPKLTSKARRAILTGRTDGFRRYLSRHIDNTTSIDRILKITGIAIEIVGIWKN